MDPQTTPLATELANASQPQVWDRNIIAFFSARWVPIELFNQVEAAEVPDEDRIINEPLFGTHIREALRTLKTWTQP